MSALHVSMLARHSAMQLKGSGRAIGGCLTGSTDDDQFGAFAQTLVMMALLLNHLMVALVIHSQYRCNMKMDGIARDLFIAARSIIFKLFA